MKNSKGKPYDYSGACSFYLGVIIVTLICQAVAGVIASAFPKTPPMSENGDFNTAFMIVIQIANALFIYFYSRMRRSNFDFTLVRRDGDGKGITPSVIIVPVILAALLFIGMYLPTVWYGYFTHAIGVPESAGKINTDTVSSVVMLVIASVLLAPTMEETIYRGVLFHGLNREKTEYKAVLFSALAFMLMHMNVQQVVFQFALGVVCGYTVSRAKRLLPAVIVHATANSLALVAQMTPLSGVLIGCELWLTQNVVAAVFITIGLFVACGAALFFVVRYGFVIPETIAKIKSKRISHGSATDINDVADKDSDTDDKNAETVSDGGADKNDGRVKVLREMGRSDGTFKYWIGIGICAVMLIVNFVTVIVS